MNYTPTQHKQLFALLNQSGLMEHRKDVVYSFTNGRTESTKELEQKEYKALIDYLKVVKENTTEKDDFMKGEHMRKRIFSMCHQYGWTAFDATKRKHTVDVDKLNGWMQKYSYLHKSINQYKYNELPQLVTQFETVLKTFLESI